MSLAMLVQVVCEGTKLEIRLSGKNTTTDYVSWKTYIKRLDYMRKTAKLEKSISAVGIIVLYTH